MSNITEEVIFLSHSKSDKHVVQAFVNHLFDKNELALNNYKLVFTDAANLEEQLAGGANTWKDIRDYLAATKYFVAFLSESFFESPWCIAELAIFIEKQRANSRVKRSLEVVKIDSNVEPLIRAYGFTQIYNTLDTTIDGLEKLAISVGRANVPCKTIADYNSFKNCVDVVIRKRDGLKKGDCFELARRHFTMPHTSDNPVSFFVERHEYEQTAIQMGMASREKILWTVFQSPLLVADAYHHSGHLMPYDLAFEKFQARLRIRLVIFRDAEEAKAYDNVEVNWHRTALKRDRIQQSVDKAKLTDRKAAFQKSASQNGGVLLFTMASRLSKYANPQKPPKYTERSFLEFACSDYGKEGAPLLLMETGFSSTFSLNHRSGTAQPLVPDYGHVTFYREMKADAQRRMETVETYNRFYGHLHGLLPIAKAVFLDSRDPTDFVDEKNIHKLWK